MEKINILIVEDEIIVAQDIKEALIELGYHVCGTAQSYSGAKKIISEIIPDLALLDIKLKGERSGIDFGKYIRENYNFAFIFLTSYSDQKTVENAMECCPDAYLVKPFSTSDLYTSIETAIHNFSKYKKSNNQTDCNDSILLNDTIFIKKDSCFIKVKIDKILFIKSEGNYLEVFEEENKKYIVRSTLKEFFKLLPENLFLRTHNSYVVNINYIDKISYTSIDLKGYNIPFSRSRKNEILNKLKLFS